MLGGVAGWARFGHTPTSLGVVWVCGGVCVHACTRSYCPFSMARVRGQLWPGLGLWEGKRAQRPPSCYLLWPLIPGGLGVKMALPLWNGAEA